MINDWWKIDQWGHYTGIKSWVQINSPSPLLEFKDFQNRFSVTDWFLLLLPVPPFFVLPVVICFEEYIYYIYLTQYMYKIVFFGLPTQKASEMFFHFLSWTFPGITIWTWLQWRHDKHSFWELKTNLLSYLLNILLANLIKNTVIFLLDQLGLQLTIIFAVN